MAYASSPFDFCLQVPKGMECSVATTQLAPSVSSVATVSLLIELMLVTLQSCGRATFCMVVLAWDWCYSEIDFAFMLWIYTWLFLMLRWYAVTYFLGHSAKCNVHFWLCKTLMLSFWDFKYMGCTIASDGAIAHWHVCVKPCSRPLMEIVYRHWDICVNRCKHWCL